MKKLFITLIAFFTLFISGLFAGTQQYNPEKIIRTLREVIQLAGEKGKQEAVKHLIGRGFKEYQNGGIDGFWVEVKLKKDADIDIENYSLKYKHVLDLALVALNLEQLQQLSLNDAVIWIGRPTMMYNTKDTLETAGLSPMGGKLGHIHDSAYDGEGLTIAVIDWNWDHLKDSLGNGELPSAQNCEMIDPSFGGIFNNSSKGEHGTACLEIIYDFLPKAKYLCYDSDRNNVEFNEVLEDIRDNHPETNLISYSAGSGIVDANPINGEGYTTTNLISDLKDMGIVLLAASGNERDYHLYFENINNNSIPDLHLDENNYLEFEDGKNYLSFNHDEGNKDQNFVLVQRESDFWG